MIKACRGESFGRLSLLDPFISRQRGIRDGLVFRRLHRLPSAIPDLSDLLSYPGKDE